MYDKSLTKRVQDRLLEMAISVKTILERNNIPYFLCAGTLLGAIRHKGFIPWDDDFDLYIFEDSYQKAMNYLKDELPNDLFLENNDTEPFYFHAWAHIKDTKSVCDCAQFPQDSFYTHKGISIDLYKMVEIEEKQWPRFKFQQAVDYLDRRLSLGFIDRSEYSKKKELYKNQLRQRENNCSLSSEKVFCSAVSKFTFAKDIILPLSNVEFEGISFKAPSNPDAFLRKVYKDYMLLPPLDQRIPHYSRVQFIV